MRDLNSELIAVVATFLHQACGSNIEKSVKRAIELQLEAKKQCDAHNKKVEALEMKEAGQ
jgi:hypothetical protein